MRFITLLIRNIWVHYYWSNVSWIDEEDQKWKPYIVDGETGNDLQFDGFVM
jgi:hypothetical protein